MIAFLLTALACTRPPTAPAPLTHGDFVAISGLCEPSGIAPDGATLRMVDDDRKERVFSATLAGGRATGEPRTRAGDVVKLDDAEAAAVDGETRWWIASHSRSKSGKRKDARQRLIHTDRSGLVVQSVHSLAGLGDALAGPVCPDCAVPAGFAALRSKEGGLDIEGLAVGADGDLIVGLRGPLTTGGAALVLSVPRDDLDPRRARGWALDLRGRGVRSIERIPGEETFLLIAGPMGGGGEDFALYRWVPGEAPEPVGAIPLPSPGSAPEGLAILGHRAGEVSLVVAYDEGARVEAAQAGEPQHCDDLLDGGASQRALVHAHLLPMTWRR